ncbi:MAG: EamA family transporter [Burkholderiales bacterium]|nr:EamA family transporter [Burkholderiales bacterium]
MDTQLRSPHLGIVLVLLAAFLWGTTGTARALADTSLAASWFGALRLALAAAFFAVLSALSSPRVSAAAAPAASHSGFVLAGLCMAGYNLAFFAGIHLTGVALGTALALGSGPLWTGLLQALLLRRRPGASWCIGTGLAVLGGALMAGLLDTDGADVNAWGVLLCLAAGLCYAVYTLVTQRLGASVPPLKVTLRAFTIAAAVALPWAWADAGVPTLERSDWLAVLYVGVVTAGLSYLLFGLALRHISAATGVTLALLEPVVACVLAATVLGESVSGPAWMGLVLALGGVALVMRAELRVAPTSPRAAHPQGKERSWQAG